MEQQFISGNPKNIINKVQNYYLKIEQLLPQELLQHIIKHLIKIQNCLKSSVIPELHLYCCGRFAKWGWELIFRFGAAPPLELHGFITRNRRK